MKKYLGRTILPLVVLAILTSCKKDKDYTASIAGKTWWGKFTYTGKPTQYWSIQFAANGNLTWSEATGDLMGHWEVDGKHLMFTLGATGKQIKADIAGDGTLFNIENNSANGYTIDRGELIANPNISSLDNSLWKGSYTTVNPGFGVTIVPVHFRFLPASKVQYEWIALTEPPRNYTRPASGVVLRGPSLFFGVIISETEMKGTDGGSYYNDWQLTNP